MPHVPDTVPGKRVTDAGARTEGRGQPSNIRGGSRMQESCPYGSVRGAPSNGCPYRNRQIGSGSAPTSTDRKSGSHVTPRWRGESAANSSLKSQNSLLAGKIQGISSIRASAARQQRPKRASNQYLTGQFPTHPNRDFFAALQGIESDHQGNFRRDQGIPASSAFWQLPADKSYRPDISNVAEKANRDAARCSK